MALILHYILKEKGQKGIKGIDLEYCQFLFNKDNPLADATE